MKTHEQFINDLKNINKNIEVLSTYVKAKEKIKVKCKICGHEWEATPNNLLRGRSCPKCKTEKIKKSRLKTLEQFIEEANLIHNFKYDYSKFEYVNSNTKGIVICPIHGEFEVNPGNHLSGKNCPQCALEKRTKLRASTTEEFIKKAKLIHGNKYDYSKVKYTNSNTKVLIVCPEHGEFLQDPSNHLSGCGCPICKQSHGETFISIFLKNNNLEFKSQYQIDIDKSINNSGKAFIDFYIPSINLFIEYNGIQHYVEKARFGQKLEESTVEFQRQRKRDEYIRKYCEEHDIKLLEIPYNLNWNEVTELLNKYIYE